MLIVDHQCRRLGRLHVRTSTTLIAESFRKEQCSMSFNSKNSNERSEWKLSSTWWWNQKVLQALPNINPTRRYPFTLTNIIPQRLYDPDECEHTTVTPSNLLVPILVRQIHRTATLVKSASEVVGKSHLRRPTIRRYGTWTLRATPSTTVLSWAGRNKACRKCATRFSSVTPRQIQPSYHPVWGT